MAKTKISEFSPTPGNNTDIDGINIAEGCPPSSINNAIRELMSQLKDFQAGTAGDSFNGPIGTTTAAAGAFTTLSASSTATLNTLASSGATLTGGTINNMAIGGTTAAAGSFTTLTTSGAVTHNAGTANGVAYLNGSKVLTTGSALTFTGSVLGVNNSGDSDFKLTTSNTGSGSTDGLLLRINSTGSEGYLWNWEPSSVLIFGANGSEQMRLTSTGLGIGTSSPGRNLTINATIPILQFTNPTSGTTANDGLLIYQNGLNAYFSNQEAGAAIFETNNAERMRLDSSGNLGLGVTPSAWGSIFRGIQLSGNSGIFGRTDISQLNLIQNAFFDGASFRYVQNGTAARLIMESGAYVFNTAPSGTAGNAISFTQAMSLTAAGDLLVGTTSGTDRLQVVNATAGKTAATITGVAAKIFVDFGGGGDNYFDATNNIFRNGSGTERARIDSSGNLLVGKTSTNEAVNGIVLNPQGLGIFSRTNGDPLSLRRIDTDGAIVSFRRDGTLVGTISVTTSATAYNTTSDYRLKTVIGPVADAGQRIDALQPVEYTWNASGERTRGFLAHQFQEVYAGSVSGTKDAVDAEGKPVYQSMQASSSEVIADLVAEIQNLRQRLAAAGI